MSTFVGIDKWVDTILGRLTGAMPEMVQTEVRNAVREFFVESTAWRQEVRTGVKAGESTIDFRGVVSKADTLFILQAFYKGNRMQPVEDFPYNWEDGGSPTAFWSPEPGVMRMSPVPDQTEEQALRVMLALKPSGCDVPSWVEDIYFKVISDGALARLYAHPKRPYTEFGLAAYHSGQFRAGIARANSISKRRFTPAEHSFRFPGGWRPRI